MTQQKVIRQLTDVCQDAEKAIRVCRRLLKAAGLSGVDVCDQTLQRIAEAVRIAAALRADAGEGVAK